MAGALLATYRTVIGFSGPLLPVVSFLGRLPTAMCQLGSVLLVAATSGSLGTAGIVGGALAAGQTVGGPVVGRLADRFGQRPVVLWAALLNAVAVAALVAAALLRTPTVPLSVIALLAGLSVPQVGPMSRSRLVAMARGAEADERTVSAALSFDGTLDEISFVLGPALVGVAATVAHPAAALILAAALLAVCGSAFALHPTARRVARAPVGEGPVRGAALRGRVLRGWARKGSALTGRSRKGSAPTGWTRKGRAPAGWARKGKPPHRDPRTVLALRASAALQGGMFGACQAGITALTADLGAAEHSGLVYGAMGVMSAFAGLAMASVPPSVPLPLRWRLATGAALVLALPLLVVGSLPALYAVVVVLGAAYAPHLITLFGLTERAADERRLAEVMAFMTSAIVGGQALALALSGPLAEAAGPPAAFAVAVGAAALACALACVIRPGGTAASRSRAGQRLPASPDTPMLRRSGG
ncbi:MFS transporter [Streptomyces sp. ODS28]|uniref:MFS transporter n=1 Tax=Streptomyces sp. ODS28 TaxID=3136688 RepID=UPI0031E923D8